jgi:hypothetical protein
MPTTVGVLAYLLASIASTASIASIGGGAALPTIDSSLKKSHIARASSFPVLGEVTVG